MLSPRTPADGTGGDRRDGGEAHQEARPQRHVCTPVGGVDRGTVHGDVSTARRNRNRTLLDARRGRMSLPAAGGRGGRSRRRAGLVDDDLLMASSSSCFFVVLPSSFRPPSSFLGSGGGSGGGGGTTAAIPPPVPPSSIGLQPPPPLSSFLPTPWGAAQLLSSADAHPPSALPPHNRRLAADAIPPEAHTSLVLQPIAQPSRTMGRDPKKKKAKEVRSQLLAFTA